MENCDAPGLSWSSPKRAFWRARPERHVRDGFEPARVRLPGHKGDGRDAERAALCRRYQAALQAWIDRKGKPTIDQTTWGYVIARYLDDSYSPIRDVKANTAESYRQEIEYWREVLGPVKVAALDYAEIKTIIGKMQEKGRSPSFIHRKIRHLRLLASYASALRLPGARDVKEVLSELRVPRSAPRSIAPTRQQIEAIVAAADRNGLPYFAAGVLLQFEYALRAVDVRGQWVEGDGGIRRGRMVWIDGLTWQMFDADLTGFEKVISKTAKSLPEPYWFDLTLLPDLRARLQALRPRSGMGPVILSRDGKPYTRSGWAHAWSRMRTEAGVPKDIWLMDARAGGLTEAKAKGASAWQLRDAGQHANVTTTDRYARGRSEAANKVVKLRTATE